MVRVVRSGQWTERGRPAFEVEGKEQGAAVTLILEEMPPGRGPRLHSHPYGEVWVVVSGRGTFTADGESTEAGAGDIVYVDAGQPHRFVSSGEAPLRMICIHQSPHFVTDWLE